MRKFLIGPALTGIGWLVGSHYGADAEQIVHKSPNVTYQGVCDWIEAIGSSGTTSFEGAKPIPYEIQIDRSSLKHLAVHVFLDGHEGGTVEVDFVPENDGTETLVKARAHGDTEALSSALSGTSMARMAYAPDWMLNLFTVRPLLRQIGNQIETGKAVPSDEDEPSQQASLSPDQQRKIDKWRQYEASQPMTDPNLDAKRYLEGKNAN